MKTGIRHETVQVNNVAQSKQTQLALKMLAMSNPDLEIFLNQEIEANPFLQIDKITNPIPAIMDSNYNRQHYNYSEQHFDIIDDNTSLIDILQSQININFICQTDKKIAFALMEYVDENGYLLFDQDDFLSRNNISKDYLENIIETLQSFEPTGVCARNLCECLKAQLIELEKLTPQFEILLKNLELIATTQFMKLQKLCGVDAQKLAKMIHTIRTLNPRPGLQYSLRHHESIIPDIIIKNDGNGGFKAEFNKYILPKPIIDKGYIISLKNKISGDKDLQHISTLKTAAEWLIRNLDIREKSIIRIVDAIIKYQFAFLQNGINFLRPMSMMDLANILSISDSTVSRAVNGKYVATPHGTFMLKFFFSGNIKSADNSDAMATTVIRHRLKAIIEKEDTSAPYSDDNLADLLNAEGMTIARRTISKYRKAMNIPSATARKNAFKITNMH